MSKSEITNLVEAVKRTVDQLPQSEESQAAVRTRRRNKEKQTKPRSSLQFSFICLVLSVVMLIILFGTYTDSFHPIIDSIAGRLGYHESVYAVILDAGSTGSRVLAYSFHRGYLDGRLVLDTELFQQYKPGLSAFAKTPEKCADNIERLLDDAKRVIPKSAWATTPLVLKATAGLRLLGPDQAEAILNTVRKVFRESGFLVKSDAVEIMDGTDEGIFSWFTINLLLKRLNSGNTVAALDLGGGSTQVTFSPKDVSRTPAYADFMHDVPTMNSHVNVFTHSYLNLGLMAVRHAVFTHGYDKDVKNIESICVNPIIKNKLFNYGAAEYQVSGTPSKTVTPDPVVDYDSCVALVKSKVLPLVQPKPVTLKESSISAFSYYYERAIETGLIDPFGGGEITVANFSRKAQEICAIANTEQPFMCHDLVFISVLLEHGFDLKPTTPLKLYNKVGGHEISWALGCAYNILTQQINDQTVKSS